MATPGQSVVTFASTFIGIVPYRLGAPTASSAVGLTKADCSSFVQFLYQQAGIALPRTADQQYKATQTLQVANPSTSTLQPGDLLFFGGWDTPANMPGYAGIQHVAIYAGNGNIIQEGGTAAGNVNVTALSAYEGHFIAATRPFASSSSPGIASQIVAGGMPGVDPAGAVAALRPLLDKGLTWGDALKDPTASKYISQAWLDKYNLKATDPITVIGITAIENGTTPIFTDPGQVVLGVAGDATGLNQIAVLLGKFTNPSNWLHLGAMLAGVALVGFGMFTVARDLNETGPQGLVSPMPTILKQGA
jgi:hypothetical protein